MFEIVLKVNGKKVRSVTARNDGLTPGQPSCRDYDIRCGKVLAYASIERPLAPEEFAARVLSHLVESVTWKAEATRPKTVTLSAAQRKFLAECVARGDEGFRAYGPEYGTAYALQNRRLVRRAALSDYWLATEDGKTAIEALDREDGFQ